MKLITSLLLLCLLMFGCKTEKKETASVQEIPETPAPFYWDAANIYFLLTDRFQNGDPSNDVNFERTKETGVLRGFMGGDIKGITQKIKEGYFTSLGVNAIWFTPVVEQIHGSVDEGTGNTYGFHGYWTKDWTALDPNFGTQEDLRELVQTAHANGIRIVLDVVLNHTGPVTDQDPVWGDDWVRTSPQCTYDTYEHTISCTLVANLPDIHTESNASVELPEFLKEKWKQEGRLEEELKELDAFFETTGHPRAPRFYIMKWLTDYVRDLGIDGYRVDTTRHVEESVWTELYEVASTAFDSWKQAHPNEVLDENEFFMFGEVYGYGISGGRFFDFGDKKVDYFAHGFQSLINFELKDDAARRDYESIFSKYDTILSGAMQGKSVVNYMTSHDDGGPFDKQRQKPLETATKLLLTQGAAQIYYGDETARKLDIPGTQGDATLRSFMNWEDLQLPETQTVLNHWQKLGVFRKNHPSIGAGRHHMISETPYIFARELERNGYTDAVVIGLDLEKGQKEIAVGTVFQNGSTLMDAYSGQQLTVKDGKVLVDSDYDMVLLEQSN